MKKILVGITTTHNSNWEQKIRDIDRLNITEAALFPTVLEKKDRSKYFSLLSKSKLTRAHHVHIRDDMEQSEIDFLVDRFQSKLFNVHPTEAGYNFIKKYKSKYDIYVENTGNLNHSFYDGIVISSGLCLDASHFYDYWNLQKRADYEKLQEDLPSLNIGCCHVSAITKEKIYVDYGGKDKWHYNRHTFSDLSQFDYLKELKQYLPDIISLELENDLEEQLEAKKYIEKNILGEK